jgi:hypothetical protein
MTKYPNPKEVPSSKDQKVLTAHFCLSDAIGAWDLEIHWDLGIWSLGFAAGG